MLGISDTLSRAENRYPVYDLADSVEVARAIRERGGGLADQPHLASLLNYNSTRSGAFITRLAAARRFGLVANQGQHIVPTALAMRILAPEHPGADDVQARLDAFMNVLLYKSLYHRYKDTGLPREAGLHNALETAYGIPRGQAPIAARVFLASAAQAGFFEAHGGAQTHLVMPRLTTAAPIEQFPAAPLPEMAEDDAKPPTQTIGPLGIPAPGDTDVIEHPRHILVEKLRDVPATDLETIREYIRTIKELGEQQAKEE